MYTDIAAWGGDLPLGIGLELNWRPTIKEAHGIGDTTPQSLYERWHEETGQPLNQNIGLSYPQIQILVDAIERAGTLDPDAVNKALGETDLMTIAHRVKYDKEQFSGFPLAYTQWQKTDEPWVWECPVVYSDHDFMPATAEMIFPLPYD